MRTLSVFLEMQGEQKHVGDIKGDSFIDARFCYAEDYLAAEYARPISISLPLSEDAYSPAQTKNFFEGLLPEGFSRRALASWIKADENDYLSILSCLGRECIGSIRIIENAVDEKSEYELLSMERVCELAAEGATKSTEILLDTHLSLAGASGKVGLYYDEPNASWYLPRGLAPSTHIVKQSHVRLSHLVLNEQLCMLTAGLSSIDVPESFIINTGSGTDSEILYATKRYDRTFRKSRLVSGLPVPERLHQEVFAQALGIPSEAKYEHEKQHYLKRIFELIRAYTTNPIDEQIKMWKMLVFHFLIGNADGHIKNFSLLYSDDLRRITLAPAYDIVCTELYHLSDTMSLYIGNEVHMQKMNRSSFAAAAAEAGLTERIAMKIFDETADHFEKALTEAAGKMTAAGYKDAEKLKNEILKCGGYGRI